MEQSFKKVLEIIYGHLKNSDIKWAIFGSANLLLQGLQIKPNDIDILTDEQGAYKIENIFSKYSVKKVSFSSNGKVQSHYGAFDIDGVKVEIIGDFRSSVDLKPIAELKNCTNLMLGDIKLPCLTLEDELISYTRLGRPEKVKLIKEWMEKE